MGGLPILRSPAVLLIDVFEESQGVKMESDWKLNMLKKLHIYFLKDHRTEGR